MPSTVLAPQYDPFARMYNEYWGPTYCEDNMIILDKIVFQNIPDQSHVLDLCCGTGQLVEQLILKGYRVTGMDASAGMLDYARKNAPQGQFLLSDARSFNLPPTFDAVISTSASLNHIMTEEELHQVFQNVYTSLKEGGLFALEINLESALESMHLDKEGNILDDYAWGSIVVYDRKSKVGQIQMTIFAKQQELWNRFDETWTLRGYSQSEIELLLQKTGFANINHVKLSSTNNIDSSDTSGSTFFVANKPLNSLNDSLGVY